MASDEGDPYAAEKEKYSQVQLADALFSRTAHGSPSLHVILPGIGWKFSDGKYIGRDPIGTFHFHRTSHFPKGVDCRYEIGTRTKGDQVWVNIKFYAPGSTGEIFGEFFASDEQKAVENARMTREVGTGKWTHVLMTDSPAYVDKREGESKLTLIVGGIWWKAEFDVDTYQYIESGSGATDEYKDLKKHEVAVRGRLVYDDEDKLKDGVWVRWDFDHLVFYGDNIHARDYTAYFMFEDSVTASMTALGKVPKEIGGVTWAALTGEERKAAKQRFK